MPLENSRSPSISWSWTTALAAALLAFSVIAAYLRGIDSPFLFDDTLSIQKNESIRRLWPLRGSVEVPGPL